MILPYCSQDLFELNENAKKEKHIKYIFDRQRDIDSLKKLWNMIVE